MDLIDIVILALKIALLALALFGNTLGVLVYRRKRMIKASSREIYMFILTLDTLFLTWNLIDDISQSYGFNLQLISSLMCKIRYFFNFAIGPISPWLLTYALVERLLAIVSKRTKFFRKKYTQKLVILGIIFINMVAYSPMFFYIDLLEDDSIMTNNTNDSTSLTCNFQDVSNYQAIITFDMFNSPLVPFVLMVTVSVILIVSIFRTRLRVRTVSNQRNTNLSKDIRLSITCIALNVTFVVLNLPLSIGNQLNDLESDSLIYQIMIFLYYTSYCCDCYILLLSNSIFRNECSLMFKQKFGFR